ncbi:hypothetical protein ACLB1G_23280 [Oxalobacteraceae bacterium A2-2]
MMDIFKPVLEYLFILVATVYGAFFLSFSASMLYFLCLHPLGCVNVLLRTIFVLVISIPAILAMAAAQALITLLKALQAVLYAVGWKKKVVLGHACDDIRSGDTVVHLVHGTFEPDAGWTKKDSPLWEKISKQAQGVKHSRVVWSGENSERGRLEGVGVLRERIKTLPAKRHIIIAHSHAGNIVRSMIEQDKGLAADVAGVALLSTPFIHRKKIFRGGSTLVHLHAIGFAIVGMSILLPLAIYLAKVLGLQAKLEAEHVIALSGLLGAILLAIDLRLTKRTKANIESELDVAESSDALSHGKGRVRLYVSVGDEADGMLRVAAALHELCHGTYTELYNAAGLHERNYRKVMGLAACLSVAAVVYCYRHGQVLLAGGCVVSLLFILSARSIWNKKTEAKEDYPLPVMLAAIPMAVGSFLVNVIKAAAFGDLRYIFYPEAFVHSSESPSGTWETIKFLPKSDAGLNHSSHSNPDVIEDLASWVSALHSEK